MAVKLQQKTPADVVTEMLAHAVTEEGLDQLYELKRETNLFYDYRDGVFTETPLLGRTVHFGWLKTKTGRKDGFRGYIRSQVRKTGPYLYEMQNRWARPYNENEASLMLTNASEQRIGGWVHHKAISRDEWLFIAHDWLASGVHPDRDPAIEAEIHWDELLAEVTDRLLDRCGREPKVACDLVEWGLLRRLVSPNMDKVITAIEQAINHQLAAGDKGNQSQALIQLERWLTECQPALTDSQRMRLVKLLDESTTLANNPLRTLYRSLDLMKALGADVTARLNLAHFNGSALKPREDIVFQAIIPKGPDLYGGCRHGLALVHYMKLRDKLITPIEVSQMSLDLLQMQVTMTDDEPVQLDLNHFKLVPVRAQDRDWIERTNQPIRFEWTLKTQA